MHEGIFFYSQLEFSQKDIKKWLQQSIKNIYITEQPSTVEDCGDVVDTHIDLDTLDVLAEVNDWLGENHKKYTVSKLLEELTSLHKKGKLYFSLKQRGGRFEMEGYCEQEIMEKYFEPLANAFTMAANSNASGQAFFISDQKAQWKSLCVALVILPGKYQLIPAFKILGKSLEKYEISTVGSLGISYDQEPFKGIYKRYLEVLKTTKPLWWEPEYAGKFGFMDLQGNFILKPQWLSAQIFSEGLAPVCKDYGEPWGYIDQTGKYIISPSFDSAYSFRKGLARVRVLVDSKSKIPYKSGFINKKGNLVIQPTYGCIEDFFDGLAKIRLLDEKNYPDKTGFIDMKGCIAIPAIFDDAYRFSEGFCFVQQDKKWGVIDKKGVMVIKPTFDYASAFSQGLAPIYTHRSGGYICGYINKKGHYVIKPQYDYVTAFSEDIAFMYQKNIWYMINLKGEKIKKFTKKFQEIHPFKHGVAVVKYKDLYGLMNKAGELIVEPQFQTMMVSEDGTSVLVQVPA